MESPKGERAVKPVISYPPPFVIYPVIIGKARITHIQILFYDLAIFKSVMAIVVLVMTIATKRYDILLYSQTAVRPSDIVRIWCGIGTPTNNATVRVPVPHFIFDGKGNVCCFSFFVHQEAPKVCS